MISFLSVVFEKRKYSQSDISVYHGWSTGEYRFSWNSFYIVLVGIAFMILFTAFQTTCLTAQSVLEGVKNETVNGTGFQGSGYISQAMLYTCLTLVNIFIPAVISIFGPALSMFLGSTAYFFYVVSYIYPMTWSYYTASILMGIGAATLWTAQGVYLALNSDESTISRNTGIFWALCQTSLLPGNIYVYLSLKTEIIHHAMRYSLFSILSVVAAVGLFVFILIIFRSYTERRRDGLIKSDKERKTTLADIIQTLKIAGRLLKTRHMHLLLILFVFLGLSPVFIVNVYGTSIGHYKKYGDTRKRLLGLHGIIIGAGEIIGGGFFGFVTKPRTSSHRAFIVFIGFVLQIIFYYCVFINIPFDAPAKETDTKPYIDFSSTTSQVITFIGSFIVGLGDCGVNIQLMNVLASRYKEATASAFAIFKLVQAIGAAVAFFYAGSVDIQWQLLILTIFLFIGTLGFFSVLFDERTTDISTFVTVQENDHIHDQYSETS